MPESIELLGFKGDVELSVPDELDRHKGELLVVRGPSIDLHYWLSGVTIYMADDPECKSWTKHTLPQMRKH